MERAYEEQTHWRACVRSQMNGRASLVCCAARKWIISRNPTWLWPLAVHCAILSFSLFSSSLFFSTMFFWPSCSDSLALTALWRQAAPATNVFTLRNLRPLRPDNAWLCTGRTPNLPGTTKSIFSTLYLCDPTALHTPHGTATVFWAVSKLGLSLSLSLSLSSRRVEPSC